MLKLLILLGLLHVNIIGLVARRQSKKYAKVIGFLSSGVTIIFITHVYQLNFKDRLIIAISLAIMQIFTANYVSNYKKAETNTSDSKTKNNTND